MYEDIINLPHHKSNVHTHMMMKDRACQFSPFAALTGFEDEVKESARLTEKEIELDEYEIEVINYKLQEILDNIYDHPEITVTYFQPDFFKTGGKYVKEKGKVKKIDLFNKTIKFTNGNEIKICRIIDLQ